MFKVGDKVRFVKLVGDETNEKVKIGDIGIITSICESEFDEYPIEVDISNVWDYGFMEEELELVIE